LAALQVLSVLGLSLGGGGSLRVMRLANLTCERVTSRNMLARGMFQPTPECGELRGTVVA